MTARLRRPSGRPAALLCVLLAVAVAAGGVAAAGAAAPVHERSEALGWASAAALAWCAAVVAAIVQRGRVGRLREQLAQSQARVEAAHAAAVRAGADTAAAVADAQASRARANAAHTESEAARIELLAARSETLEARSEAAAARAAAADERAELARLEEETIPGVVQRLRAGASVATVLADHRQTAHEYLLSLLANEIAYGERQRAAALAVCATAAGRVQALATSMHAELREMQHQHGEDVLGDLLRLDHSTAQAGRMADSIAVLTGARTGRRWTKPISVESILRGALGRIGAYQRVRLHSASTAAVAGYAAEGVMHALAELLDNATNFSAPPAEVHVYVEELHSGLVITVEDGGLGLSEVWLRRAELAVSGRPLDLTALSAGTRLGFAVVGALARKHGLSVSFRPSSRGGTGVVVLIPEHLVTHPEPAVPEPARAPARSALPPAAPQAVPPPLSTEGGLPKRRRGQTMSAATGSPAAPAVRVRQPEAAGRFGAFRQAVKGPQPASPHPAPPADLPKDNS
ncbi:signal transduction histidine kinase [Kitasatospora sp. MAP12-15]|uniref:sensor histidine kinase n=1 Tax=unclassified Kitasatospora TaxID=2633591 RepID=UPI002473E303|nr:ATP-binding protein [Kitasatospora sp. MAP12-44]MDH6113093.1 signal transduction histidine kinase [Kitasatospora sp. MAP12-44]